MHLRAAILLLVGGLVVGCGSPVSIDDSPGDETGDETGDGDSSAGTDGSSLDSSTTIDSATSKDATPGRDADKDTTVGADTTVVDDSAAPDTTLPPADTSTCSGIMCGSKCVDTRTAALDCGSCGTAVCHLEVCTGSAPACAPKYLACGGSSGCLGCKDIASDPDNCGGCGTKCSSATGQLCVDGKCTFSVTGTCPGSLKRCATSTTFGIYGCFDTNTDVGHCGSCDTECSPGQYCRSGKCLDYASAPGCTSCPCASCAGPTAKCCTYAGSTVCSAGDCPAG